MHRHLLLTAGTLMTAAVILTGCGESGSSGTAAPPSSASGAGCAPVAGDTLVVLTDDKNLQNTDNIVPAINKKSSSPQLVAALDKVSAALDTAKLIELNKAVDIDRKSSKAVAQEFATAGNLTAGIAKGPGGDLTVGAANFAESKTLGELYNIVLTAAGYTVEVQQIGNRELYEPALEKGEIDVVPEYAATLATFLAGKVEGKDAKDPSSPDLTTTMTNLTALGEKSGLVLGTPSPAQNQNAFAVTDAFATKYGVKTLSDLAAKCSGAATVLGGPPECPQRPKCQQGLVEKYGFQAGKFSSLDAGGPLTKTGLKQGTISVGLVFSSDGALAAG
ncbi:glycine betaine ABC transporter substrate-binding protein [Couchioplanes caeruleus]|uniref:Glycine/betaine ABC transporter substrate-binding protein n=2 Tax=Couchioplanes caeruleus TaxID=56438 RepID=A0A1K0GB97_9ACTN|nr:glycine betaine ABC transporter substrate-binding protein [Couchioplanes caeruleus]OJF09438.1 glycine/betaine ABC transporter substrate-binding protein [Couchioplanes caeruleus subsp. caeruleus]ROP31548.1 osmoprotectant transport system substrate-binding protein [Couchioplanes caeruleus]